jgi:hypothetical protein
VPKRLPEGRSQGRPLCCFAPLQRCRARVQVHSPCRPRPRQSRAERRRLAARSEFDGYRVQIHKTGKSRRSDGRRPRSPAPKPGRRLLKSPWFRERCRGQAPSTVVITSARPCPTVLFPLLTTFDGSGDVPASLWPAPIGLVADPGRHLRQRLRPPHRRGDPLSRSGRRNVALGRCWRPAIDVVGGDSDRRRRPIGRGWRRPTLPLRGSTAADNRQQQKSAEDAGRLHTGRGIPAAHGHRICEGEPCPKEGFSPKSADMISTSGTSGFERD